MICIYPSTILRYCCDLIDITDTTNLDENSEHCVNVPSLIRRISVHKSSNDSVLNLERPLGLLLAQ